jgi:hypothetical protein
MVEAFTLARALASVGWTIPRLKLDDPIHKSHLARATFCIDAGAEILVTGSRTSIHGAECNGGVTIP